MKYQNFIRIQLIIIIGTDIREIPRLYQIRIYRNSTGEIFYGRFILHFLAG